MPNLQEIKARRSRISQGPWEMRKDCDESRHMVVHDAAGEVCSTTLYGFEYPEQWDNGRFIANAPADIDWLVQEVEGLRGKVTSLENNLQEHKDSLVLFGELYRLTHKNAESPAEMGKRVAREVLAEIQARINKAGAPE